MADRTENGSKYSYTYHFDSWWWSVDMKFSFLIMIDVVTHTPPQLNPNWAQCFVFIDGGSSPKLGLNGQVYEKWCFNFIHQNRYVFFVFSRCDSVHKSWYKFYARIGTILRIELSLAKFVGRWILFDERSNTQDPSLYMPSLSHMFQSTMNTGTKKSWLSK